MKKQVYELDEHGFIKELYVSEVDENGNILESDKTSFIAVTLPHGLFKPKWNGTEWIEGVTQEEIDELILPNPSTPSLEDILSKVVERLEATESALFDIILGE